MGIQSPGGRLQSAHPLRPPPLRAEHTREQHFGHTRQASSGPSGQRPTQPPRGEGHPGWEVPSPVSSQAAMSGGGGPSAGRAGPASGWSHVGLRPPSSWAAPRHPGQGWAALPQPAQRVQRLLVPQACPGQQPCGPGTPPWGLAGGAAWWGTPSAPSPHPVVSTQIHRACGSVPAVATPPPHSRMPCPSRLFCSAGAFPGLTQSSCPQAPDCRPLGSSTPPPGVRRSSFCPGGPGDGPGGHPGPLPMSHPGLLPGITMAPLPGVTPAASPGGHPGPLPGSHPGPIPRGSVWTPPRGHPGPLPRGSPWAPSRGSPRPPPGGSLWPPSPGVSISASAPRILPYSCVQCVLPGPQEKGPRLVQFCLPLNT